MDFGDPAFLVFSGVFVLSEFVLDEAEVSVEGFPVDLILRGALVALDVSFDVLKNVIHVEDIIFGSGVDGVTVDQIVEGCEVLGDLDQGG